MKRTKIEFGIDLGTTNSSIVKMQGGEPRVYKSDTTMDTMPSCVGFNKKGTLLVGSVAFNSLNRDKLNAMRDFSQTSSNFFIEFKRTMGTDKAYYSSHTKKGYSSEELSAEVLKTLKTFVKDDDLDAVVITVPAKFTINQKDATLRAAKLAGFKQCELLQEPIAAAMAYGLKTSDKNGYWLVFDFGGGTFDAALIKVEDGIMKVTDTEGDNYLGGKNLDYAIVDELIIPYLNNNFNIKSIIGDPDKLEILRDAMKQFAEEIKIQLSFKEDHNLNPDMGTIPGVDDDGCEFSIDLTITQGDLAKVIAPIFQKSIDICKDLLRRNNLMNSELDRVILVGGPTYSPILRKMLREQITDQVDTSCDPMTVVASGAALFAATLSIDESILDISRDNGKTQIALGYEPTTVEQVEFVTIKLIKDSRNDISSDKYFAEIIRSDKAWSSGKVQIDGVGEIVEVVLEEGKANAFNVVIFNEVGDRLECEPDAFTIIQGSKVGSATLPYHIGIEILSRANGKLVFKPVKGLEKNKSLPAKGVINGLKTQNQINPGIKSDNVKIPIYQGEFYAEGSRAFYNEHVYDVIITGDEFPLVLPENSDVDITIYVDRSERISFSAFFPAIGHTLEVEVPSSTTQKEIDPEWLETEIAKARQMLQLIIQDGVYKEKAALDKLEHDLSEHEKLLAQGRNDYDRKKQVLNSLRLSLKKLDEIQDSTEWPKIEDELEQTFYHLEQTIENFGGQLEDVDEGKLNSMVVQFKEQIPHIKHEKNIKIAKDTIEVMRGLDFQIADQALGPKMEIMILRQYNENFDLHEWSDPRKARALINQGLQMASNNPTKQKLRPLVVEMFKLLPGEKSIIDGPGGGILVG